MANTRWGFFGQQRRRHVGYAAVSLSSERVALAVQLADSRGVSITERSAGSDAAQTLADMVREAGAAGASCEWVLEPSAYSLLQVDKPAVPQSEWVSALRWKVRDLISYPVDEAVMDAFEVPGLESRGRSPTLYVASARKSELRGQIAQIQAAGLQLARIGIADLACAEVALRLSPSDESQAVLALDARGGSMLALREGTLFVVRRFEFDADDQRAMRDPTADRSQRLFERFALELQRTLDYFERTHQRPPVRRLVLLAGVDGAEGLGEALRTLLGLEVLTPSLEAEWPSLSEQPAAARVRLAVLAGVVEKAVRR